MRGLKSKVDAILNKNIYIGDYPEDTSVDDVQLRVDIMKLIKEEKQSMRRTLIKKDSIIENLRKQNNMGVKPTTY